MLDLGEWDRLWSRPEGVFTGRGTLLAIIDQGLWCDHPAYSHNLYDVRYINGVPSSRHAMHGAAVVSIASGDIGIAPDTRIMYCAIGTSSDNRRYHYRNHLDGLRSLRDYALAAEGGGMKQIDAISTSHGWMPDSPFAKEQDELVAWFEKRNIPVFSTNDNSFMMCGRSGIANAWRGIWNPRSHEPARIGIPVDERLLACMNQEQIKQTGMTYYRCGNGGMSWAMPYVAGMFMLAREAWPTVTRGQFLEIVRGTAQSVTFSSDDTLQVADVGAMMDYFTPKPSRGTGPRSSPSPQLTR